jgi:PAS domain S-box-containing protein/putative nucleotidyltransferase with HDIG domain
MSGSQSSQRKEPDHGENISSILNILKEGLAVTDSTGRVVLWTESLERITRITKEEAAGNPLWDLLAAAFQPDGSQEEARAVFKGRIEQFLQKGKSSPSSDPWRKITSLSADIQRQVEIRLSPLETENGVVAACVVQDASRLENDHQRSLQLSALEAAANGIAITNVKGKILWVNNAFTELTGYQPEEAIGKTFRILKSDQQDPEIFKDLWETVQAGKVWRGELINRRKDGSLYYEEQTITPVRNEKGIVTRFIAVMQDNTASKQVEQALLESEQRHKDILDNIQLIAVMLDQKGKILYCNRFFLQLVQWKQDEVIGKNWFALFIPEEDREGLAKLYGQGQVSAHHQNEIVTRSGERRVIAWNNNFVYNDRGQCIQTTSIGEDITDRQRAEAEAARLAAVVEQIAEGVIITDKEREVLYANPYVETLTGFNSPELLGKPLKVFDETDGSVVFENEIWKILDSGQTWQGTIFSRRKDGSQFHEEMTVFPIRSETGEVTNYAAVARDITDRVNAEEQAQQQVRRLAALRTIDLAINSSLDLRVVLNVLLDQVVLQLNVDAASLLLLNPHTQMLEYADGRGFRKNGIQQSYLRLGQGLAGKAASERRSISVPNFILFQDSYTRGQLVSGEDFVAYFAVPLIAKGQVKGVLEVYNRTPLVAEKEWMNFLETLAGQAAIAIDNSMLLADLQRSNEELTQAYVTTLEGWVRTLGLRDYETEDHTHRVTMMTLQLAKAVGLPDADLIHIRRGALLHDIGKMAVPDHILLKDGPLDDQEWEVMRRHPTNAYQLLSPIAYLKPALDIPYCHHEKWDGTGYPRGMRREEIPIAARLFSVADVWDALRSDRPYRKAWDANKVMEYLREQSGKHFDPDVLDVFFTSYLINSKDNGSHFSSLGQ